MSAPRLLGLVAALPLLAVGLAPASTATAADPAEAPAPTQLLQLTTSAGEGTAVAQAGLDDASAAPTADAATAPAATAPAATAGGSAVAPGRAALLAAATTEVDPEKDATLLTAPVAVDDFLVAGFRWKGSAELPTGTQIYLRVREDGQWSPWYLNEASDAGREDGTGLQGTDEFVTGGADAVQASVISPSGALPSDLNLAMVPGQPTGQEQVDPSDLKTVDAPATEVSSTDDSSTATNALGPIAQQVESPTSAPATASARSASGSAGGGSAVSPAAATLLAATTTANSLPVAVTTRSEWGANESYMTWSPEYYEADHVVVHHTAGSNDYSQAQSASVVNGIYYYHAVTLGWGDIGYNFLVSKYGQVFEGRYGSLSAAPGKMVAGGHALGVNNGTMGISMLGDFSSISPASAQLSAVGKMAGWFLGRQGITSSTGSSNFVMGSPSAVIKYPKGSTQNFTYIFAHRDVNYTTCPGDVGYSKMSEIRSIAQAEINALSASAPASASAAAQAAINAFAAANAAMTGSATNGALAATGGGAYQRFQNGVAYWTASTGVQFVGEPVLSEWGRFGWQDGVMGYPVSGGAYGANGTRHQVFQGGIAYWSGSGPVSFVRGEILNAWAKAGWESSSLGMPTAEAVAANGVTTQTFQHGVITVPSGGTATIAPDAGTQVSGQAFNASAIISDAEFFGAGRMTSDDVRTFLRAKNPECAPGPDGTACLQSYRTSTSAMRTAYCQDYAAGQNEDAATIITKAAAACGVSERTLIVLLQKEQGLVTASGSSLSQTRYTKATGFRCPDNAACDPSYAGLASQLYYGASRLVEYGANPGAFRYRAGGTYAIAYNPNASCGSATVTIANRATAALYNYTPYQPNAAALKNIQGTGDSCSSYGNRNFWRTYLTWFGTVGV